jgi:cytochrome c peroxidase
MTGRKKLILGFAAADFVIILLVLLLLPFQAWEPAASTQAELDEFEARTAQHFERIEDGNGLDLPFPAMPLRDENPTTPEKVALGQLLYFDPLLSGDDTLSCAHTTCPHSTTRTSKSWASLRRPVSNA